jgi:TonB-dependent receptor
MMEMRALILVLLGLLPMMASAQGTVRGKITDGQTGETLIGANAFVEGTTKGAMADLDGNYNLTGLEPGTYQITGRFIGYAPITETVTIAADEVVLVNFNLYVETFVIEQAAEVVAKVDRTRDVYMENIKKKSAASIDYISSQQIKRTGDTDAASAMKRVTGVSTVGNFVFVRGLSDRYLKTTLNGAEVPSIDPRRNTIEMDLFPTNLVDNLVVVKTQTANLPSDWAGAYISVETKDFPETFSFNYSSSLGWNTNTTGKELISSPRSGTDWLGYDDGFRALPALVDGRTVDDWPTLVNVSFGDQIQYLIDQDGVAQEDVEDCLASCGMDNLGDIANTMDRNCILDCLGYTDQWGANFSDSLYFNAGIPASIATNQPLTDIGQGFENTWEHVTRRAAIDMKHSLSFGNQTTLFGRQLGYIFGAQYGRNTRAYQDGVYSRWAAGSIEGTDSLDVQNYYTDERTNENHRWNALLNLSYKLNEFNKVSLMGMTITSGTNSARFQEGLNPRDGDEVQQQRTHRYQTRNLNTFQMRGEHYLPANEIQVQWTVSRSEGKMSTPDLRTFFNNYIDNEVVLTDQAVFYDADGSAYDSTSTASILGEIDGLVSDGVLGSNWASDVDGTLQTLEEEGIEFPVGNLVVPTETDRFYTIQPSRYPAPSRYWRSLEENKTDIKVHASKPIFGNSTWEGKFTTGLSYVRTTRNQSEDKFTLAEQGNSLDAVDGSPTGYFNDSNLVVIPGQSYIYSTLATDLKNTDEGYLNVFGAYAMVDAKVNERLSGNLGVRLEMAEMEIQTGVDTTDLTPLQLQTTQGSLSEDDFMPSLNMTYLLGDIDPIKITNLRFAYSRTLARPVFREKAPFRSFDFETLQVLKGNPQLDQTRIDNFDLRLEHFPNLGEVLSASVFFKRFTDPIEQNTVLEAVNTELTWSNLPYANVWGLELEGRKNFSNLTETPFLKDLTLSGNISVIRSASRIWRNELETIRAQNPLQAETRPLFGQAPYILNGVLTYANDSTGLSATVAYNVQGPKVLLVTLGSLPNVMQQPTPTLDFSMSKLLGDHVRIGFKARNLLNPRDRKTHLYNGVYYDWNSFTRGRTYSLSLSYRI